MKNFFDFNATAKEFSRTINANVDEDKWYAVDAKSLQLRWTDIEIRKYRLHQATGGISDRDSAQGADVSNEQRRRTGQDVEDDDEPLPPLEQVDEEERDIEKRKSSGANLVKYDGNSSEDDTNDGNTSGRVTYYTNLDELD